MSDRSPPSKVGATETQSRRRNKSDERVPADTGLLRVSFPALEERPRFVCYDRDFRVGDDEFKSGVYYHGTQKVKGPEGVEYDMPVDRWICSPLRVLAILRTGAGHQHSYLLAYTEHGEPEPRRICLPQALLIGRADEALRALRDVGISVLHKNAALVRDYLDNEHLKFGARRPDDFWRSVKTVGWAPAPVCFVMPGETLGNQARVWFSGRVEGSLYAKDGTLEDWQKRVAARCAGNPFLTFAVSAGFSGPLLELCNIPGIGFHFHGDSTCGKTTALVAGVSVWGPPSSLLSWRTTVNGLESQAAARSSTLIALDESHMILPKDLDASVYLLANGAAKARMTKDIAAREITRWWLCVLSSGERSIESHLGAAHVEHKVGQGIRIADIPVTGRFGLFDNLHDRTSGSVFSDEIRNAAAEHHGHAGPLFVQRLIDVGTSVGSILAPILTHFGADLSAQEQRVARGFALVACAGELAIAGQIVPWGKGTALSAAVAIFKIWRAAQPQSARGKEHAQIIDHIVDFIDRHGNARFCDIVAPNIDLRLLRDHAGYWQDVWEEHSNNGKQEKTLVGRTYLFTPGGLKEASGNFGMARVVAAIEAAGAFVETGEGGIKSKNRRVPEGGTKRLYHIDAAKLRPE